jgi:hypothetical protein
MGGNAATTSTERLAYNRVPKAGSMTACYLLHALAQANGFVADDHNEHYHPNASVLRGHLEALPPEAVYINHANFMELKSSQQVVWVNLLREPISRFSSLFYYDVDPISRSAEKAATVLKARERDPCFCARLEFDSCIKSWPKLGCGSRFFSSRAMQSQWDYFCMPSEHRCTVDLAIARMHSRYRAIGIVEEFDLSLSLFERRLPRWFANASYVYARMPASRKSHSTEFTNNFTGTSQAGAISNEARSILHELKVVQDETRFYREAVRRFWYDAVTAGLVT